MSGFLPTGFHCVTLAIARVHQSARRRCRGLAALPALTIVDLPCGAGSTLRALARNLPAQQHWKLIDNDLGLLERAANASHPHAKVTTTPIDLVRDLEAALDGPLDLVTTLDSARPGCREQSRCSKPWVFWRERCGRLGDEATRSGHAGGPSRRLAGYGAGGRATVAA